MNRQEIQTALSENVCKVVFTKSDGSERVMTCTLHPQHVQAYTKKTERVKKLNDEVVPVFDLEKNEWRSFRADSVKYLSVVSEGWP